MQVKKRGRLACNSEGVQSKVGPRYWMQLWWRSIADGVTMMRAYTRRSKSDPNKEPESNRSHKRSPRDLPPDPNSSRSILLLNHHSKHQDPRTQNLGSHLHHFQPQHLRKGNWSHFCLFSSQFFWLNLLLAFSYSLQAWWYFEKTFWKRSKSLALWSSVSAANHSVSIPFRHLHKSSMLHFWSSLLEMHLEEQ